MIHRHDDVIIQTVCRIMIPFIQLFGLYVIAHGHHSPGGGFQGGVILGAGFILLIIAYDLKEAKRKMKEKWNTLLASLGLLIYSGIGLLCLLLGGNYLDYAKLPLPLTDQAEIRFQGILGVEVGVGITVMAIMFLLVFTIASFDKEEKEDGISD